MKGIINVLLWVWQFPQHIVALVILALNRGGEKREKGGITYYHVVRGVFGCGVSLGNYILLPDGHESETTVRHEMGHQIQSRRWGVFYLLSVGLVSAIFNNLWDRLFHKDWSAAERNEWYYSRWPENEADRLGGVQR